MRTSAPIVALLLCGCVFDPSGVATWQSGDAGADADGLRLANEDGTPPRDAGPDVRLLPPPDAAVWSCGAKLTCVEGKTYCPGDGGLIPVRSCPLGCNGTGNDCVTFDPSNVDPSLLLVGSSDWVIQKDTRFDTTTGELSLEGAARPLPAGVAFYGLAQHAVLAVGRLTLNAGVTFEVRGKRTLIVVASDRIRVFGTIACGAAGSRPGPGGFIGGRSGEAGAGCGGGFAGQGGVVPPFGGGTGGSYGGFGGKGGDGANGRSPCGSEQLVPLAGGSGGGGGRNNAFNSGGGGGAGGGAVQLTAWAAVEVSPAGVINCGGGGGEAGSGWPGSAGGGGSGGAVLIEAPEVISEGVIAVNGGGGGGGGLLFVGGAPGTDGSGGILAAAGGLGADVAVDRAGNGGAGAAGKERDGAGGQKESPTSGGGGGGSGRVCIRSASGAVGGKDGKISPNKSPPFTLLKLPTR